MKDTHARCAVVLLAAYLSPDVNSSQAPVVLSGKVHRDQKKTESAKIHLK